MDASTLKVADTAAIHLKGATGEPLYHDGKPVRIIVHSPGTKAFGAVEARQTARSLKRMNENEGKITAPTSEERVTEVAEDLAALTIAVENLTYGDLTGTALSEAIYRDPALGYITRQVAKFLADWGNFKPGSPGN